MQSLGSHLDLIIRRMPDLDVSNLPPVSLPGNAPFVPLPRDRPVQPPHAPELGPARRLLGSLHVTGIFWYRFHRWGVSILPNWGMVLFTVLFTSFFFIVLRRIRKAIAANLDVVLGPCGWWQRQLRIYRTMWNFAWCLSERYERLSTERRGTSAMATGEEHWQRALASPEGMILTTAHIGHWELGAMRVPQRHVHVVREEEMDPQAQKFVRQLFSQQASSDSPAKDGGFTMHFVRGDPTLGPRLLKALRPWGISRSPGRPPPHLGPLLHRRDVRTTDQRRRGPRRPGPRRRRRPAPSLRLPARAAALRSGLSTADSGRRQGSRRTQRGHAPDRRRHRVGDSPRTFPVVLFP